MRRPLYLALAAMGVTLAACGTEESTLTTDQQGVVQAMSADAAWFEESPGIDGAVADAAAPAAGAMLAPGDTFHFPAFWGRSRRAASPTRTRTITITGDTAVVSWSIAFNGVFRVDTTLDGIRNAGSKPLVETASQAALFVRDSTTVHGWRLAGISVRRFQNTAPAERTVNITSVGVRRNSDTQAALTDPTTLLAPGTLTSVSVGDTLAVIVKVSNTTGTGLVPPTQMFVHVRHLQPGTDLWVRFPMTRENDSTFKAHWVVRRPGPAIIAVDALDSETLMTESGDDYRSDLWAVPVRVQE